MPMFANALSALDPLLKRYLPTPGGPIDERGAITPPGGLEAEMPQMPRIPTFPQTNAPAMPEAPQRGGFLSRNGLGVDLIGGLADGVLALNGMRPVYGQAQDARRQRQQAIEDQQRRQAEEQATWVARETWKRDNPAKERFETPTGDYVEYDPVARTTATVYDAPDRPVTPTALEQQVALVRRLDPTMTDAQAAELVRRGISGAQYDPNVYRPMTDYKAAQARATKAMPTYAQANPRARAPVRPRAAPKPPAGFILD